MAKQRITKYEYEYKGKEHPIEIFKEDGKVTVTLDKKDIPGNYQDSEKAFDAAVSLLETGKAAALTGQLKLKARIAFLGLKIADVSDHAANTKLRAHLTQANTHLWKVSSELQSAYESVKHSDPQGQELKALENAFQKIKELRQELDTVVPKVF